MMMMMQALQLQSKQTKLNSPLSLSSTGYPYRMQDEPVQDCSPLFSNDGMKWLDRKESSQCGQMRLVVRQGRFMDHN